MSLSLNIRTAYFAALNGSVTLSGVAVPVFDTFAPVEQPSYPYIILSSQTTNQRRRTKRCKQWNATILIDVVTGNTDPIGRSQSEVIAEQIDVIVNPDTFIDLTLADYEIGYTIKADDFDQEAKNDVFYIYRKLIRYEHLITKK